MLASTNRFWILLLFASLYYYHGLYEKVKLGEELSSPYKLIGRDKAERWIQTTLLPHEIGCVPILVLSKQCDSLALLYTIIINVRVKKELPNLPPFF